MALKKFPPKVESLSELEALQLKGLQWTVQHTYRNSPFYKARLDRSGRIGSSRAAHPLFSRPVTCF